MAVVVPQPPLLVPELAAGAAAETAPLRDSCEQAVRRLAAAASTWVAIGADAGGRRSASPDTVGSLRGFGVDLPVALGPGGETGQDRGVEPGLPLPLLVAGWLRGRVGCAVRVRGELVPPDLGREACRELGARLAGELAAADEPTGVLVLGDGAATHTERAPGHFDPRAAGFDAVVAAALAGADTEALLALDADLAEALLAAGRAPWQVLAGLAAATGDGWRGELLYSDAPYGVAYHVAVWTRG